jgi:hypothetical protein
MSPPITATAIDDYLLVSPKPGCTYGPHSQSYMDVTNTTCRMLDPDGLVQKVIEPSFTANSYFGSQGDWFGGGSRSCIPGPETCSGSYAEPSCAPGHMTATELVFQNRTTRYCCLGLVMTLLQVD